MKREDNFRMWGFSSQLLVMRQQLTFRISEVLRGYKIKEILVIKSARMYRGLGCQDRIIGLDSGGRRKGCMHVFAIMKGGGGCDSGQRGGRVSNSDRMEDIERSVLLFSWNHGVQFKSGARV